MSTSSTTSLPRGVKSVEVQALHLGITHHYDSGGSHRIHLVENGDIEVILSRGQQPPGGEPIADGEEGTLVVALGVDGDHDAIHYTCRNLDIDAVELLGQAEEAISASRLALIRAQQASA